jgi:prophage regulatory protein
MRPDVESALGLRKSAIHERIRAGLMVRGVSVGEQAVRFPAHEVQAIVSAHLGGFTEAELRALVIKLHAARAVAAVGLRG